MITRINSLEVYNPIRDHISLNFELVQDGDEMLDKLTQDLISNGFNPEKSRVLVFVRTKKLAEEASYALKDRLRGKKMDYADKVDYYHAGLEGTEREERFDNYNNGETVILIATKAFGMGMDIKNIHFIYHLGPSSTFEDYLQEIGRAGRNVEMLTAAGFSSDNPIQTKCLLTKNDFKKLKDLQHGTQITWYDIKNVRETMLFYVEKFRSLDVEDNAPFPLPLDLLEGNQDYEEINNKETFFRVALYWLEKLERIRLGVYIPTHLPLIINSFEVSLNSITKPEDKDKLISLRKLLMDYTSGNDMKDDRVIINLGYFTHKLKVNTRELYRLLFIAQSVSMLEIDRNMVMQPTKTRTAELVKWGNGTFTKSPIIEAVFNLAEELINLSQPRDQINLDGEFLDQLSNEISESAFNEENIFWKEKKNNKQNTTVPISEIRKKLIDDFKNKRAKFAFKLIGFLPKIKHKTIISLGEDNKHANITQLIYNGNENKSESIKLLQQYKKNLYAIINHISKEFIKRGKKSYNIVDLLIKFGMVDLGDDYLQQIIFLAKSLAYLKGNGSLVPMGIEMYLLNTNEINEEDRDSLDFRIFNEYIENSQMKELRLLALECLSIIPVNSYDKFIKEYFRSEDIASLIHLLEEYIGEDHENLRAFRTEALKKAKKELSEEQRAVYEAPITRNLQVIAGPGSGKTHTLILRVAKLIQEEKVSPENILVLAYNRAVVVELKERLGKLFKNLGYAKLINRLKVFTFHGFVKYCLKEEVKDLDFDQWTQKFLNKAKEEPGLISQILGPVKFVFVDEFQDITTERLEMLKLIANPTKTHVCVIGDPNQSIYGYERANAGDSMDPKPYYDQFDKLYHPLRMELSDNYRSYPDILDKAEELLSLNESKFPMPKLNAIKTPVDDKPYCEIIDYEKNRIKWKDKLLDLVKTKDESGRKRYKQIAIMFRSNNEVYRAYNLLQDVDFLNEVRIRVQGSKASYYKTREFHYVLNNFYEGRREEEIKGDHIKEYEVYKAGLIEKFPAWDKYLLDLFHCLLWEFEVEREEGSVYGDLIEFVKDLSFKDDGQLGKIYRNHILKVSSSDDRQEIIITTMHKVKGLEFDAVLTPPSFSNLPQIADRGLNETRLKELIEEERRLYYVAYTRAKYALVAINYNREKALLAGKKYEFSDEILNIIGVSITDGTEKLFLGWGATERGLTAHKFIEQKIKVGDKLKLKRTQNSWSINVNGRIVGYLSGEESQKLNGRVNSSNLLGFSVSGIYVFTYQDSVDSDERNRTGFSKKWLNEAKERGYIYIIDFSGYGKLTQNH